MARARWILAPAALLLAAGCSIHPGAAAVVDGTTIAMERVEALTPSACRALSPPGSPPLAMSAARRQVLVDLVVLDIARAEAARRGIRLRAPRSADSYEALSRDVREAVQVLGPGAVAVALSRADIDTDPRFGLDAHGNLVAETGSISAGGDPQSDFDNPAGVPGEGLCG